MEPNIKDIITRAENLSKKISSLRNEKTLPAIELDIILLDIRTLYEEIKSLQTVSSWDFTPDQGKAEEVRPTETHTEKAAVEEKAVIREQPPEPAPNDAMPEKVPETKVTPVESSRIETPPVQTSPVETPQNNTSKTEISGKSTGGTTLGDKYKGEKKFINESLAGNLNRNDIGSKIQSKPIQNISSALGINDRFKLINDLFNGDKDSFQNTVSVLDASSNFNEAFNYITSSFDWDMEEESVQLLLELVRRKFIVNQNE